MKTKIKVVGLDGSVKMLEVTYSGKDHLASQQNIKANVYRNRKKYRRKNKYPHKDDI